MSDGAAVDAAVLSKLAGDAVLAGFLPDGVFFDVSPPGKTRFAIVSLLAHEDTNGFDAPRAYERSIYLVKAVTLNSSGADANAAAARIDVLLHRQPLTIVGFDHMSTLRLERVRYPEVDAVDADIRWQHRGGQYEIFVSPHS